MKSKFIHDLWLAIRWRVAFLFGAAALLLLTSCQALDGFFGVPAPHPAWTPDPASPAGQIVGAAPSFGPAGVAIGTVVALAAKTYYDFRKGQQGDLDHADNQAAICELETAKEALKSHEAAQDAKIALLEKKLAQYSGQ